MGACFWVGGRGADYRGTVCAAGRERRGRGRARLAACTRAKAPPPTRPAPRARGAAGCLRASMVGAGNAGGPAAGANAYDSRRTSSSMLVDPSVRARHAALAERVDGMQRRAQRLFCDGAGEARRGARGGRGALARVGWAACPWMLPLRCSLLLGGAAYASSCMPSATSTAEPIHSQQPPHTHARLAAARALLRILCRRLGPPLGRYRQDAAPRAVLLREPPDRAVHERPALPVPRGVCVCFCV